LGGWGKRGLGRGGKKWAKATEKTWRKSREYEKPGEGPGAGGHPTSHRKHGEKSGQNLGDGAIQRKLVGDKNGKGVVWKSGRRNKIGRAGDHKPM